VEEAAYDHVHCHIHNIEMLRGEIVMDTSKSVLGDVHNCVRALHCEILWLRVSA
jgi:hypothetical protein